MTQIAFEGHLRPLLPSPFERTVSTGELAELDAVLNSALDLVRPATSVPIGEVNDFGTATRALEEAWEVVRRALKSTSAQGDARDHNLLALIDRLRRLDVVVRESESRRRQAVLQAVGPSLSRLQAAESLPRLIALVPEVICHLGFDRAIMSRVIDAQWVTEASHVVGDEAWADIITQVGQLAPASLRGASMPESEVVRRRAPALVRDVQSTARVHRPMAEASLSRSYVAAPIVLQSHVVGLVHGDRVFHRGDIDSFDRDILAMFADGLSLAFERASMEARLQSIRSSLHQLIGEAAAPDEMDRGLESPPAPLAATGSSAPRWRSSLGSASMDVLAEKLTRRELQIVRHLARGETNAQIASRLVLSEDTVKTHVKHILRKLGASNRAEAVSKWLLANAGQA
ncbi:helix-turn-helix transcriptional regulator [Nocardia aurea]|uniref:helix-turn-helix transcriptional regulator n=1 Tax=Nocardia aurea TaxID=2144174 RepID=UPI0013007C2A|nr:LuxR C-terminal-related transcriptional regulator [Nocardia aurea]